MIIRLWRHNAVYFCLFFIVSCVFCLFSSSDAKAQLNLPTKVTVIVVCGDGMIDIGEFCDPGEPPLVPAYVGTSTCQDFKDIYGNYFTNGDLGCTTDCTAYATSTCYTCGNGNRESVEECEGSDFGGQTCLSYGFDSGSLLCRNNCHTSTVNCVADATMTGGGGGGPSGGNSGATTGFLPGSNEFQETKVIIKGKAYPDADAHILVDGKVIGIVKADTKADFYFESNEITPGIASFGFWSEDKLGLKSTLLSITFRVVSRAATTISGIYIAPTIDIDKKSVKKGEGIKIFGQTAPETEVHVHVNSEQEFVNKTNSVKTGDWSLNFDTSPLEEDFHTAKALFQLNSSGNVIQSGFSRSVSFYVGKTGGTAACPNADLNKDGSVNLTDFSILLYYWGTDNECADQNQNGTVDLVDFSIMMYYWTG